MFNFPAAKPLQLTFAAALLLTACGGDNNTPTSNITSKPTNNQPSTANNNNNINTPQDHTHGIITKKLVFLNKGFSEYFFTTLALFNTDAGDALLRIFRGPEIKYLESNIEKRGDGDLLTIRNPTSGEQKILINSRDAKGNINNFKNYQEDSLLLSRNISILGNRAGMLCTLDDEKKPRGQYIYLSDAFIEIDATDKLVGINYATFIDCNAFQVNEYNTIKKLAKVENSNTNGYPINWAPFSKDGEKINNSIERAKSYKATIDGKDVYAIIRTLQTDGKSAPSKITLSIGLK